jgi:hypothetical protein
MILRALSFLSLVAVAAVGCSSSSTSNQPPVIDALEGPATASIGASGNYELTLTVSGHDDDGNIVQASIEIPGFASNPINTPAQPSFKGVQIKLQLGGNAPKGPLTYTLVITDDQGGKASKSATVTLQ